MLHSDEIRNRIIGKYNLIEHYEIGDDVEFKMTKLQKEYERNVTFKRTKFMSVEISVLDRDPLVAANIANDIAALLDTVKNRMRREVAIQALAIVTDEYNNHNNYIQSLEDSLAVLRDFGIIDYESQAERITEQMSIAILQGKKEATKQLQKQLSILGRYGGEYVSIRDQLEYEKEQSTYMRAKYREAQIDAEANLQHKFIVNNAFPAEKKSYPIRWLIVVVSTLSTFLLTLVSILFIESIKSAKLIVD